MSIADAVDGRRTVSEGRLDVSVERRGVEGGDGDINGR